MNDPIERQDAIDALAYFTEKSPTGRTAQEVVKALPSAQTDQQECEKCIFQPFKQFQPAQRTGRWIPVSERLPEDGSEVWATIKGSDVIKVEAGETIEQAIDRVNRIRWVTRAYWSEEEHGWNDPTFGCPLVVQPIAWMPIEKPEPYKEEQK